MREQTETHEIPVITIDGPSGTGKGTIASLLAKKIGWHVLDSGAIYRAAAWAIMENDLGPDDENAIGELLKSLEIKIRPETSREPTRVICGEQDITEEIRTEECGMVASETSSLPVVRAALLHCQHSFRKLPGLIADGRDMGTVVFPDAGLKIFLDASENERVKRRFKQLQAKGISVSLGHVREDLQIRDNQDANRTIAPAKPAEDSVIIDTTDLSVEQILRKVLDCARKTVL